MRRLAAVVLCLALGGRAAAYESTPQAVLYAGEKQLFADFDYDTGWVPANAAVQVRFALVGGSGFSASLPGMGHLSWPEPVSLMMLGDPGAGLLRMNLGLELIAKLRLHLDTGTTVYDWEGDLPFLSSLDLRFADDATFTPFVLPGVMPPEVVVEDEMASFRLFKVDLTDSFIPIPGIGGGFELIVGGNVRGGLSGVRFEVEDRAGTPLGVLAHDGWPLLTPVAPASRMELAAHYFADLAVRGQMVLTPSVYVQLVKTWDLPLCNIPIDVVDTTYDWDLGTQPLRFPLPVIGVGETLIDFGAVKGAQRASHDLALYNFGELELLVTASTDGAGYDVQPVTTTIPPNGVASLSVGALAPAAQGTLALASSDPNQPLVTVVLRAAGDVDQVPGDGGTGSPPPGETATVAGGCGCRTAGAAAAGQAAWLLLLGGAWARRRRR